MKENNKNNFIEFWVLALKSAIPFWENWSLISKHQKEIIDNYLDAFNLDGYKNFLQLAPAYLSQTINPWSFSLIQFTKEIKGSPALEYKILTEVAGYGSQLGTIMDYLEILQKTYPINPGKLKKEDAAKYYKFDDLAGKIKKLKEQ